MKLIRSAAAIAVLSAVVAHADSPNTIKPYAPLQVTVDHTFASADGTWDFDYSPDYRNAVEIQCFQQTSECTEAVARVDQQHALFFVHMQSRRVTSWTASEVAAVDIEACTTTTLTINAPSKEVLEITRNGGSAGGCTPNNTLDHPIIKKLVSASF